MKSIMQDEKVCWQTGRAEELMGVSHFLKGRGIAYKVVEQGEV